MTTVAALPPAMAALERMRAAWEKAGRPGPGARQLVIEPVAQAAAASPTVPTTCEGGEGQ